jgi:hypothetical protein
MALVDNVTTGLPSTPATAGLRYVVIPLTRAHTWTFFKPAMKLPVSTTSKETFGVRTFKCELSFAITYHKVQGKTLDNVVLDISGTSHNKVTVAMAYMGFSRVRTNDNIRVLPTACVFFIHGKHTRRHKRCVFVSVCQCLCVSVCILRHLYSFVDALGATNEYVLIDSSVFFASAATFVEELRNLPLVLQSGAVYHVLIDALCDLELSLGSYQLDWVCSLACLWFSFGMLLENWQLELASGQLWNSAHGHQLSCLD